MERIRALIASPKVCVASAFGLHLEAAWVDLGVAGGIAIKQPRLATNIKDKGITLTQSNLTGHFLIGPLVIANRLQIIQVFVDLQLWNFLAIEVKIIIYLIH